MNSNSTIIKGYEKIADWKWSVHGTFPVCKCGRFLTLIGDEELEWICIRCEPEKLEGSE